jgi:predicted cobalt transporter CbtA
MAHTTRPPAPPEEDEQPAPPQQGLTTTHIVGLTVLGIAGAAMVATFVFDLRADDIGGKGILTGLGGVLAVMLRFFGRANILDKGKVLNRKDGKREREPDQGSPYL